MIKEENPTEILNRMKKEIIYTKNAPEPIGPYNQAIKIERTLYVSGQIPLVPGEMKMVKNDLEKETNQVMKNIEAILYLGCLQALQQQTRGFDLLKLF